MLIEVFEAEKSRLRWYYLAAYGAPLLVVAISSLIDPFSYGTDRYCWLRADNYFILSFVGPVILVLLVRYHFVTYDYTSFHIVFTFIVLYSRSNFSDFFHILPAFDTVYLIIYLFNSL